MSNTTETADYLTLAEAAEHLGTTVTRVLMLIRKDDLKGTEINGEWFVEPNSLNCCKAHVIDMKAAKGCVSYCSSGGCGCH